MKAVREHVAASGTQSFRCFQFATARFDCPYHYHPEAELTLIVDGRGQRLVGDDLAPFGPGDLVLMGPDLPHSYFHAPGFRGGPRAARAVVAQFLPGLAGGRLDGAPEWEAARKLLARSRRGLVFGKAARERVIPGLRRLSESREGGLARLGLFLEIVDTLAADRGARPLASAGFRPTFNKRQADRIERVCQWATERFREPVTLAQAARQAHLTPSAFSRFFRRATNRPFVRFVNELRVGHACRLLLETEEAVSAIAFESGFENLSNFNRRFREMKGTTPRGFRAAGTRA